MSYARHILNITEIMERKKFGTHYHCWWHWGTFEFSAWFHPVFCIYSQAICSELNLKLTYGIGRHYLLWIYTHILCSEQSHCKTNQFIFLPPDELWWLNFSVWWPKVIDQHLWVLAQLTDFVVVIFQLRRCHSIFSCCLHYSLHSAILSWEK